MDATHMKDPSLPISFLPLFIHDSLNSRSSKAVRNVGGDLFMYRLKNELQVTTAPLYNIIPKRKIQTMDVSSSDLEDRNGDADEELEIDLIRAAMNGNVKIFEESSNNLSDKHIFRKSVEKNNILHIAIRYEQTEFVEAFLKKYFAINKNVITGKNSQEENTPFHIAAEVGKIDIVKLLFDHLKESVKGHEAEEEKPWRAKNSKGNTALHVALLYDNPEVAEFLMEMDGDLARIVNNSKEAPLHLAIPRFGTMLWYHDIISKLLKKARCVASWRDAKGLTPLHRATFLNPSFILIHMLKTIILACPESTLVGDATGKSILHLLIDKKAEIGSLLHLKEIRILKDYQDQDGNTPLHIAAKQENINMVRSLLSDKCGAKSSITNNDGISAMSMIQQQNLHSRLEDPTPMTEEDSSFASKGDIDSLLEKKKSKGKKFLASQDSKGSSLLHHLMKYEPEAEHHYLSSPDDYDKFLDFINETLSWFPKLVCQTDQDRNTPLHILAQNKKFCNAIAYLALPGPESNPLSELLSIFDDAINALESKPIITNEADNNQGRPWVVRNDRGNTPLHEAIIANNKAFVLESLSYCQESACLVNENKETPLHLLAGSNSGMEEFTGEQMMKVVKPSSKALELSDKDGLTPLTRALKAKNLNVVVNLLCKIPEFLDTNGKALWHHFLINYQGDKSDNILDDLLQNEEFRKMLKKKDKDGNTPLHLAIKEKYIGFVQDLLKSCGSERESNNQWLTDLLKIPDKYDRTPIVIALRGDHQDLATKLCFVTPEATKSSETVKSNDLSKNVALRGVVLEQKDNDGDTPLHIAIKWERFHFVKNLLETCRYEKKSSEGNVWLTNLLKIPNNRSETPENLLADLPALLDQLEEQLLTDRRMRGIRSSWRIPRSQLETYMNSMNVIAALQTTITFTAAFAVPGGLIQDKGTPILIQSIAFQVFMISDVISMCLSMMVLICLLWIVATTSKRESVLIQDFALSLLLASFFATLVTFMSGVYATIFPVKPRIAISTLVLCTFLMLLVQKFMVTKFLLPIKNATSNFVQMLLGSAAEFWFKTIKKLKRDESDTSPNGSNNV